MSRDRADAAQHERKGAGGVAIVALGIVLTQVLLFGPSLFGDKVLLPVDLLAQPGYYLPRTPETAEIVPHDPIVSDLVLVIEPALRFAAAEFREGRLPLWNPHNFAGSRDGGSIHSPFYGLYYAFPRPETFAWVQLLKSLFAGLGAYAFFRLSLNAPLVASVVGGICMPLTGFFVLWQGFPYSHTIAFLPWILLATDRCVARPFGWGLPSLALMVAAIALTELGTTGQTLLVVGLYALWRVVERHRTDRDPLALGRRLGAVGFGLLLGLMLAAPLVFHLLEHVQSGERMLSRAEGLEERPPVGMEALPQMLLPDVYGTWQRGGRRLVSGNRLESSAAAYAGLITTLALAPLAFAGSASVRRRVWPWVGFLLLGSAWVVNVPGLVSLLRLPGLNMLSHNRFVFLAGFACTVLAVIGMGNLERGEVRRRNWFALPIGLTLGVGLFSVYRVFVPPELLASEWSRLVAGAPLGSRTVELAQLDAAISLLASGALRAAILSFLALGVWGAVLLDRIKPRALLAVGVLAIVDLTSFAHGVAAQPDRSLAYPDIPALRELGEEPGRSLCLGCLPPALNRQFSLRELRGYDAVDPRRWLELLREVGDPKVLAPPYAKSMWFRPRWLKTTAEGVRVPPALDMLGLRHVIRRGTPPRDAAVSFRSPGYWVSTNPRALDRVFVPEGVITVGDSEQRLRLLAADDFEPRQLAVVEVDIDLPGAVRGAAQIEKEHPQRIVVGADMETRGLVVLSDRWDAGWNAYVNGKEVPILRANHAVRGVVVPAGRSRLEFRYEPDSLRVGGVLTMLSLFCLAVWSAVVAVRPRVETTR